MMRYVNNRLSFSFLSFLFAIGFITYLILVKTPENVFIFDVLGYYLYLPATFHFNDIRLSNIDEVFALLSKYQINDGFYQAYKASESTSYWVIKYPIGMAIAYAPFYLIADVFAEILNYPKDGFSKPYQWSVVAGCFFYTCVGLYYLKKILQSFFSDKIVAVVILITVFATNYLIQVSIHGQPLMVHNIMFTLLALCIYYIIQWHKTYQLKHLIYIFVLLGLIAIVRPPEFLVVLFFLFYNVYNKQTLLLKYELLKQHKFKLTLGILIFGIIVSIQLMYWKYTTGKFLFYSYQNNLGEGFNFLKPYVFEFLFSFRKGWLLYTPIMLFALIGLFVLFKKNRTMFLSVFIYFILNFYVMSSWSCWWYGDSFSSRAIIPSYVILSIPLGFMFVEINKHRFKYLFVTIVMFLIALNLFQSWQVTKGIIHGSNMSRAYYFSTFLQTEKPTKEQKALLLMDKTALNFKYDTVVPDLSNYKLVLRKVDDFDKTIKDSIWTRGFLASSLPNSYETNLFNRFCILPNDIPYKKITKKSHLIFRLSTKFFTRMPPDSLDAELLINMQHSNKWFSVKSKKIKNSSYKQGVWNELELYYITPDFWNKNDFVQWYFWNQSNHSIYVDDLTLEAYEPIVDESVF
ncbi:MAG: hypothetical protein IT237_01190 [Bacteroidia bacterium]|nr:hypothetical protein [Bacteroidia bacterium]